MVDIQQIAAFDLDGTLVSGQTQAMLVRHLASKGMLSASTLAALGIWFAKYRFGMPVEHEGIRLRVMQALAGHSVESFDRILDEVHAGRIAPRLRPAGRRALRALEDAGVRTVIVSAAPEPLVSRVVAAIGATGFVATRLEKDAGYYTGRIEGPVIEGDHKISALSDWADRRYGNWILKAAFGDNVSDAPLMHAAHEAYAVWPDRGLRALRRRKGGISWNGRNAPRCRRGSRGVHMYASGSSSKEIAEIAAVLDMLFERVGYYPTGRVFVKPNLSGRAPILESENTTVYFMDGLLEVLHGRGCDVVIGHSSLLGTVDCVYPFERVITDAGFAKYSRLPHIALLDLDFAPRRSMHVAGRAYEVPEIVFDADSYINLAKLKTHMETGVSLSMKNQMGLMSHSERIRIHREALDRPIAELSFAAVPTVSIVEGIVGMEGAGPHHGRDKYLGKVFVGTDMLELDVAITAMMGLLPDEIGHLSIAGEISGSALPSAGEITASGEEGFDFSPATAVMRIGPRLFVYPTTSCSRCITALIEAGRSMRNSVSGTARLALASYVGRRKSIVIGSPRPADTPSGRVLCIGQCASRGFTGDALRMNVCPPSVGQVERYLRDNL